MAVSRFRENAASKYKREKDAPLSKSLEHPKTLPATSKRRKSLKEEQLLAVALQEQRIRREQQQQQQEEEDLQQQQQYFDADGGRYQIESIVKKLEIKRRTEGKSTDGQMNNDDDDGQIEYSVIATRTTNAASRQSGGMTGIRGERRRREEGSEPTWRSRRKE